MLCNVKLVYHGGTSSMRNHLSAKHDRTVSLDSSDSSASEDHGQKINGPFRGSKEEIFI